MPCRSVAWWLGENANFGANEFAWSPRLPPPDMIEGLTTAEGMSQDQLALAAVSSNPVLSMILTHLQRTMLAGSWEVRNAAAQVQWLVWLALLWAVCCVA